jgi:hypothetical protein
MPVERSRSPLVGLLILASLPAGRLVGRIVAVAGDLAVIEALDESEIPGPGLLLLRLSGVALPDGRCRLFHTRDELAGATPAAGARATSRRRSAPRLVATDTQSADA